MACQTIACSELKHLISNYKYHFTSLLPMTSMPAGCSAWLVIYLQNIAYERSVSHGTLYIPKSGNTRELPLSVLAV